MSDMPPPPPPNMVPPPGYVQYGGYGAIQGQFRKIGGMTKWLVGLMAIAIAIQVISLLVQLTLRNSASDFLSDSITSSQFDDKLAVYLLVVLLAAAVSVGQIVLLVIWTFRLAKNHQLLGRQPQTFSPGATIAINILGGCTLGILNFFMWRELWKASDPETAPGDPTWKQRLVSPLIGVYLGMTLASVAAGLALGVSGAVGPVRTSDSSTDLAKNLSDKLGFVVLAGLLSLASAVVFIMIVRQLAARHMQATRESSLG
jgi:hypothetical protein